MSMAEWAEREIRMACKRENPDWDGKSFDYGCSCYMSALKAFNSILEDDHSGYSFSVTANILNRLMHNMPLSPITEEDFDDPEYKYPKDLPDGNSDIVDKKQCPRMSSLFRTVYTDGHVKYHDINRVVCVNVENTFDTFLSWHDRIVDELFPITLPYYPIPGNKYQVYVQEFASKNCKIGNPHGTYDTVGVLYIKKPDGTIVDVNRFYAENDDSDNGRTKLVPITKEEYDERLATRLYTVGDKLADIIIRDIVDRGTCCDGKVIYIDIDEPNITAKEMKICREISEGCKCFDGMTGLNLFEMSRALILREGNLFDNVVCKNADMLRLSETIQKLYAEFGETPRPEKERDE